VGFLTGLSFLGAFIFLIAGFVSLFRRKKETLKGKPKQQFAAFVILLIAGTVFAQFTDAGKEEAARQEAKQTAAQVKEEKQAAAEKRKKIAAETKKKKAAAQAIENFESAAKAQITDKSNGVIQHIQFDEVNSTSSPMVRVFVKNQSYLASSTSEKQLFAKQIDEQIERLAIENKIKGAKEFGVLTDFYSFESRDTMLMQERVFKDEWKLR
jgi:hypothetical protein